MRVWNKWNAWHSTRRRRVAPVWPCFQAAVSIRAASGWLLIAACELPTAPPKLQTRLLLPIEAASVGVAELLPPSVEAAGARVRLTSPSSAVTPRTLGAMCGTVCAGAQGQLLGRTFTMSLRGPVTGRSGEAVVRPGQEIGIASSFELVLEFGGG